MKKAKMKKRKSAAQLIRDAKAEVEKQAIVKVEKKTLLKLTLEEAKERTDAIRTKYQAMGRMWWELGRDVQKVIEDRVPEALGQTFTEWAESVFGDGWQKIRRAFLSVKALRGVSTEKLEKISEGNAYALAHLPEKTRRDPDWVKKAIELPNEKFKEAAERFIARKTGLRDPMVKFQEAFGFATLPKSLATKITSVLKMAAKVNDFDWDQKEGRISSTEDVFASYELTYQEYPQGGKLKERGEVIEGESI